MAENLNNPNELAEKIIKILDDKKANDIKLLHVEKQTIIADYFIICSGTSNTQIRALASELEVKLKEDGLMPKNIEGYREGTWVLLDYHSVIVHIFNRETRNFYNLEKLWNDAVEVDISNISQELDKE
jgi:iojap-like ribosome-associated protein